MRETCTRSSCVHMSTVVRVPEYACARCAPHKQWVVQDGWFDGVLAIRVPPCICMSSIKVMSPRWKLSRVHAQWKSLLSSGEESRDRRTVCLSASDQPTTGTWQRDLQCWGGGAFHHSPVHDCSAVDVGACAELTAMCEGADRIMARRKSHNGSTTWS